MKPRRVVPMRRGPIEEKQSEQGRFAAARVGSNWQISVSPFEAAQRLGENDIAVLACDRDRKIERRSRQVKQMMVKGQGHISSPQDNNGKGSLR